MSTTTHDNNAMPRDPMAQETPDSANRQRVELERNRMEHEIRERMEQGSRDAQRLSSNERERHGDCFAYLERLR